MCEVEYTIEQKMDLPPYWIGVQLALSNVNGFIPSHEREVFNHFCSMECLTVYLQGEEVLQRKSLVDRSFDDDEDDDEGFEGSA
jgi:hypothetical protein